MEQVQRSPSPASRWRLSTHDLAVAGVFGALAIVLAFTPLGMIPVPNVSGAATSLHLPAIVAGLLAGPVVGALVGLVLAIASWLRFGATFITMAGGDPAASQVAVGPVAVALLAAFLPRMLIGVLAYAVYRPLRRWPALAAGVAGLVGTLTNTFGVLGLLLWLGVAPAALLVPVLSLNVPIEIALALVVTIPTVAALQAVTRGQIAAAREYADEYIREADEYIPAADEYIPAADEYIPAAQESAPQESAPQESAPQESPPQ